MYINDISHVIRYSNVEQYADDTLLYFASDNVNIIESNLSSDLESVTQWLSANYLILNSTKSKIMLVGTHQRLASKSFSISSNGRDLERSEKFKYLGVFMDPTLSWKSHINYLGKKISSRLGMLRRARKILPQSSCIILYNTMILPLFDYCSVVWDSCGAISKGYLDKLNGHAVSIILNRAVSETDIVHILGWPSLQSRRDYLKCILVFKSMNSLMQSIPVKRSLKMPQVYSCRCRKCKLCMISQEKQIEETWRNYYGKLRKVVCPTKMEMVTQEIQELTIYFKK